MREILFRGKKISDGKWVYGDYHKFTCTTSSTIPTPTHYIMGTDASSNVQICVDPATVGQYTGLSDKNAVKVFEWDIMEFDAYGIHYCGVVTIISANASILCGEKAAPFLDHAICKYGARVIGNVHDNQDLLKLQTS